LYPVIVGFEEEENW